MKAFYLFFLMVTSIQISAMQHQNTPASSSSSSSAGADTILVVGSVQNDPQVQAALVMYNDEKKRSKNYQMHDSSSSGDSGTLEDVDLANNKKSNTVQTELIMPAAAATSNGSRQGSQINRLNLSSSNPAIEAGQVVTNRSNRTARGFVTTTDGKRYSVKLELADLGFDENESDKDLQVPVDPEELHKQMAKDILQVTQGDGAHKEHKYAHKHFQKMIQSNGFDQADPELQKQLDLVRKISLEQVTARKVAKVKKSPESSQNTITRVKKSSPRGLYLKKSPPNSRDEAYAALKKWADSQLIQAGKTETESERRQKIWSQIIGGISTTLGIVSFLLTYFLKSNSNSTSTCPTNTTMPG